jgi:hypothetical protein
MPTDQKTTENGVVPVRLSILILEWPRDILNFQCSQCPPESEGTERREERSYNAHFDLFLPRPSQPSIVHNIRLLAII